MKIYKKGSAAYNRRKKTQRDQAAAVAGLLGGDLWLFNPIVGQLREITK